MTTPFRFGSILVAGGLLFASAGAAMNVAPSALAFLASGDLVVLDVRGLFKYSPKRGTVEPLGAHFGLYQGFDVHVTTIAGVESILVTQRSRASRQNRIVQFDASGRERAAWMLPDGRASGVAVDTQSSTAYIVNSQNGEVLRLDFRDQRPVVRRFARIPTVGAPGPAVLDVPRGRLLVADAALGLLWSVSLDSKKSVRLLEGLGTPSDLAIDPRKDQLYITDASRSRVLRADLGMADPRPQLVIRLKNAKDLWGLAVDLDGTLWLGAATRSGLWQFPPGGEARFVSF